ncbi:hypothetical protein [Pseudoneobacillus sp. C159]
MSKNNIDDIKNLKKSRTVSPLTAISEELVPLNEEINVGSKEESFERKRVSFDLRTDLHKELKILSTIKGINIYIMLEDAIKNYLEQIKKG